MPKVSIQSCKPNCILALLLRMVGSSCAVGPAKKPLIYPEIDISEILHPQSKKKLTSK